MNWQEKHPLKFAQRDKSAQQGVVLLEALIAILLFSMGVLAVVGLQAAMIKNTADSRYRSEASYIAQQWIGRMWADPDNAVLGLYLIPDNTNPNYDISAFLPSGTRKVEQPPCVAPLNPANCPFVITVTWIQPGQSQRHIYTATVNITGG